MSETISVFICDDHAIVADSLAQAITKEPGIEVVGTAGTVQRALAAVNTLRPDVVLMDYELPDGNGVEATVAIKQAVPTTQVVILTSFSNDSILVEAIEAGCTGFMTKQQKRAEIVAAIRAAAIGESMVSPDMLMRLLPRIQRKGRAVNELTPRELEVLELLAAGAPHTQIEADLHMSRSTVRNHVQSILTKTNTHSRLEAVAVAVRDGIISR